MATLPLPALTFPLGGVDPPVAQNANFKADANWARRVDTQIRNVEAVLLALQTQVAIATPAPAVYSKIYTPSDNNTVLPAQSIGAGIDTTTGPVSLFFPAFGSAPKIISYVDAGSLVPGSAGFAGNPAIFRALGNVIWDPIARALVNSVEVSTFGKAGSWVAVLNDPDHGSFWMPADGVQVTNCPLGVVDAGVSPAITLSAQSQLLLLNTNRATATVTLPDLGAYSAYTVAITDTTLGANALVKHPCTITTTGGLQIFLPWGPPGHPELARTLASSIVLGGVNDWPMASTTVITLIPKTPPVLMVTG